ncbi:MAG: hypothetical protein R2844_00915 [Caldilineales bacterium]
MAELLLEHAQKKLIRYRAMSRAFEDKYGQSFASFRQDVLRVEPGFEQERDYFDWELAVTGIADVEEEIVRLRSLSARS